MGKGVVVHTEYGSLSSCVCVDDDELFSVSSFNRPGATVAAAEANESNVCDRVGGGEVENVSSQVIPSIRIHFTGFR